MIPIRITILFYCKNMLFCSIVVKNNGGSVIQSAHPGSQIPHTLYADDRPAHHTAIVTRKTNPLKTHRARSGIVQQLFSETGLQHQKKAYM
jgi:hypothetical protein